MRFPSASRSRFALLLGSIAAIILLQLSLSPGKPPTADAALELLGIAATLSEHGVYSDRFMPGEQHPPPGRHVAPGYPALIAALAYVDRRTAKDVRCFAEHRLSCNRPQPLRNLVLLQVLACLVSLSLAGLLAYRMSGSPEVAALATVLMFLMGDFAKHAPATAPITIALTGVMAFLALIVHAHMRTSVAAALASGFILGALALVDPYYAALALLAPLLLVAAEYRRRTPNLRFALAGAAALALGTALLIGPWMVRNYLSFGDIALTGGSQTVLLAQRLAYNDVSAGEWLGGLIHWLPGIGEFLSGLTLDTATAAKFALYYPGSLLMEGDRILAAAQAGGRDPFRQLLAVHVLGDPVRYLASTVLLILRGLSMNGGLLALWGLLVLPVLISRLAASRPLGPFLLVGGCLGGLTVTQALLTPNLPWMNVPLSFAYAYAVAEVAGGLELPIALRQFLSRSR